MISEGVNEHLAEGVVTNLSDITTAQLPELCPLARKVCEVKKKKQENSFSHFPEVQRQAKNTFRVTKFCILFNLEPSQLIIHVGPVTSFYNLDVDIQQFTVTKE